MPQPALNTLPDTAQLEAVKQSARLRRWCWILAATLLIFALTVEVFTRLSVDHLSRIERRTSDEYIRAIAPADPTRTGVLIVGNSLLDAAIDVNRVTAAFSSQADIRRFVVESTPWTDWYYGIRRLFAEGARPKVLMLLISIDQLVADHSRGEYAAWRLVSHRDILDFSRDLHLHPTETASIVLSNYSMFYGLRSEIRKVILLRSMPSLTNLLAFFRPVPISRTRSFPDWESLLERRANLLRQECARYGARPVLLLPPNDDAQTLAKAKAAAARGGVETLIPFTPGEFSDADYSDHYHLGPTGAAKYTTHLIDMMPAVITQSVARPQ